MNDRMLDTSIRRSATEAWYVAGRASQRDRYARCLDMLTPRLPEAALVYDLGAGTGHFARLLAAHARQVIGVERLRERTDICRADNADAPNLQFLEGDFLDLDVAEQSADAVCALEMLYYLAPQDWDRFLDKIVRTLKPGGLLLASINAFPRDGIDGEAALLRAVGERLQMLDIRHMHRMYYYRLELPLIRLLDEITYLEQIKVFYPHTLAVEHVVYSPWLDRVLLPPSLPLDRVVLPAARRLALLTLGSGALYRLITGASRLLAPRASRSQTIILARRPPGKSTADGTGDRHGAHHPG